MATEANSTAVLALQKFAPQATPLLFQEDAQCVAAVQQGRAVAYVLDQAILISDASTNPAVKVVGEPFTQEPYGIGVPMDDPTAKQFVNDWLAKIYADGSWAKLWSTTVGTVVKGDPPRDAEARLGRGLLTRPPCTSSPTTSGSCSAGCWSPWS